MGRDIGMNAGALAERLAEDLHAGQLDKAGKPYIGHLRRVVGHLLERWPDAGPATLQAAWLHDTMEDTGATAESLLKAGVEPEAVSMIGELTKPAGVVYLDWIRELAAHGSIGAIRVKLADNRDNSDPARVAMLSGGDTSLVERRYRPARLLLEQALDARGEAASHGG